MTREISKRVEGVDYRAMGAAAYLGLGSIWALRLSSSAALYKISGTVFLNEALFTWQNIVMIIVLLGFFYLYNVFSTQGGLAAMDLNVYNFTFLMVGMLLHWTPKSFLKAAGANDRWRSFAVSIVCRNFWCSDGIWALHGAGKIIRINF